MSLTRLLSVLPEPLFSEYKIQGILGVGAYAVVYQIQDLATGESFALKVVEKEPMRVRLMLPQLTREVHLLDAHADTPHVVELLETIMTTTHVFLRFPICQTNLEDLSKENGPMTEEEAFRWLRQACVGVEGLHASGVIHRDLKPSNFLVDDKGQLRVCDFGWACREEEVLTGQCGTPEYSPPETSSERGRGVHTTKVDMYGLGASLQHMLLGRVPKGRTDLPKGLSASTHELLAELMESDAEARPTIEELLARPQLEQNILAQFAQLWNQLFDTTVSTAQERQRMQDIDAVSVSCGLGGPYPMY